LNDHSDFLSFNITNVGVELGSQYQRPPLFNRHIVRSCI